MSLPLIFHRAARIEFDEAADWYNQRQTGVGERFTRAVRGVLARAANQPDFYSFVRDNVREGIVQGFPYCVFYREEPGRIFVLAVFHNARDPAVWERRI